MSWGVICVKIQRAHTLVMVCRMMFGEVITMVSFSWGPIDIEVALLDTIP